MNILITGANGYIGKNLIHYLRLDPNNKIFALTRTRLIDTSINNIVADLTHTDFCDLLPKNIDIVVHLAQSTRYKDFPNSTIDVFNVNIRATQYLLEWARKSGVKKFIFSSSGNVYEPQNKLLNENDICQPVGYYGASKYAAEQLIAQYASFFRIAILRIFGVYGPNQKNMTIANLIERVKNNQEITLASGIGLCFTPLYIDDCVKMIDMIIRSQNKNELYNFSGIEKITIAQLAELINKFVNRKLNYNLIDTKPTYLMGDSSLFQNNFEFIPQTNIYVGIKKTLSYE